MRLIVITIVAGRNGPQKTGKKIRIAGDRRKNREYLDDSIIEIGQNTEKSPGELRRLVTQTSVEAYQLTLVQKLAMPGHEDIHGFWF